MLSTPGTLMFEELVPSPHEVANIPVERATERTKAFVLETEEDRKFFINDPCSML
jgi:hypothetical protein